MSISINDYLTGAYSNTSLRTTSAEKKEQEDSAVEAGKTKQGSVSSSQDQVNLGEDGIAVTEVSRTQEAQTSSAQQAKSPRTDTVEISTEGKAAAYEAEDLSEYTDSELKQMYYQGEITLQEYEEETGETLE